MYSNSIEWIPMILSGLGTNVLIVILSSILPLVVGIGLTVLMHFTRKTALPKVFRLVSVLPESIAPIALILVAFFFVSATATQSILPVVITLTVCFLGYMVIRYDDRDSLIKNILVHGIGLLAELFKWSLAICGTVAVRDLVKSTSLIVGRTYEFAYYFIPLIISFCILIVLYIGRQLCKEFMK